MIEFDRIDGPIGSILLIVENILNDLSATLNVNSFEYFIFVNKDPEGWRLDSQPALKVPLRAILGGLRDYHCPAALRCHFGKNIIVP